MERNSQSSSIVIKSETRTDRIKDLVWERDEWLLLYKRLSGSCFRYLQDLITGVENVSIVTAYINVETPTGTIALKKNSEDEVVQGISFTIKGDNFNKTVKTDKMEIWL